MNISNRPISLFILLLIFSFVFHGCGSTNSDSEDPSVNFNSGNIAPEGTYTYTFDSEGTFEYYCTNHAPNMQGSVTVSSSTEAVERDTVIMENNQFNPQQLSVAPNTEVVWINRDDENHTVTSGNPSSNEDPDY